MCENVVLKYVGAGDYLKKGLTCVFELTLKEQIVCLTEVIVVLRKANTARHLQHIFKRLECQKKQRIWLESLKFSKAILDRKGARKCPCVNNMH